MQYAICKKVSRVNVQYPICNKQYAMNKKGKGVAKWLKKRALFRLKSASRMLILFFTNIFCENFKYILNP